MTPFNDGGALMYPLLFLALLAVPASLAAIGIAIPKKLARTAVVSSTLVMALGLMALGVGAVGRIDGRRRVMKAITQVDPDQRLMLLERGTGEAELPLQFGLWIGLPALLAGALCLAVQSSRLRRESRP